MPNTEVIKKWVEALRSGEYKQTTGKLHRVTLNENLPEEPPGMCCLGVLCDLAAKAGVVTRVVDGMLMRYDGETHVLPPVVRDWAGLGFDNPYVKYEVYFEDGPAAAYDPVSVLNDDHRLGFSEIADAIEATYLAKSDAGQPA